MAKFTLECPKCSSINTPPSALKFWQKEITCVTCGEEFSIKQSRMVSKTCPNPKCGKIIVCDQKKLDGKKCPSCGTPLRNSATAEYKVSEIVCPQCSCQIEIDKTKETAVCPICDKEIDVKQTLAKADLVSDNGVSVIKYEGDNETFVWKHPIEDFNLGSQLIVHESQEAVFYLDGQALDLFGPGRHTLETENLPVLKKIYDLPTDKQNPFHAEVYFVNKTVQMAIKWGTDSAIRFIDPITETPLGIGASGEMNLQVKDARKLLVKLVGTTSGIAWGDNKYYYDGKNSDNKEDGNKNNKEDGNKKGFTKTLKEIFKPLIMTTVNVNLAAAIENEKINILDISKELEKLSDTLREKVSAGFEEYGLFVPQFYVRRIVLPEKDPNFIRIKELLTKNLKIREEEAKAEIAAAKRMADLEEKATETEMARRDAEIRTIKAQAEANEKRLKGLAEADVMAAMGYNQKDVLQADVQIAYAKGIGQLGSNGGAGGSGGSMMTDILGLGVGMAAMGAVGEKVGNAMKGFTNTEITTMQSQSIPAVDVWKCDCGYEGNVGKYCSECGKPKQEEWKCPKCGKSNKGRFCSDCGAAKPEVWDCPHCGTKGNKGAFCPECGKKKEDNQ